MDVNRAMVTSGVVLSFLLSQVQGELRINTSNVYSFTYLQDYGFSLHDRQHVAFAVKTSKNAHVALSRYRDPHAYTYEVVIGDFENTKSIIRDCTQCTPRVEFQHSPLDGNEYRGFWISWKKGIIRLGSGTIPYKDEIVAWRDDHPHDVYFIAVSTGLGIGSQGNWIFDGVELPSPPTVPPPLPDGPQEAPGAMGIGVTGIFLMVIPLLIILILDIPTIISQLRFMRHNLSYFSQNVRSLLNCLKRIKRATSDINDKKPIPVAVNDGSANQLCDDEESNERSQGCQYHKINVNQNASIDDEETGKLQNHVEIQKLRVSPQVSLDKANACYHNMLLTNDIENNEVVDKPPNPRTEPYTGINDERILPVNQCVYSRNNSLENSSLEYICQRRLSFRNRISSRLRRLKFPLTMNRRSYKPEPSDFSGAPVSDAEAPISSIFYTEQNTQHFIIDSERVNEMSNETYIEEQNHTCYENADRNSVIHSPSVHINEYSYLNNDDIPRRYTHSIFGNDLKVSMV